MSRRTAGIPCPKCDYNDMSVIEWFKNDNGILTGMRLLCMKCEHPWDYWNDEYGERWRDPWDEWTNGP